MDNKEILTSEEDIIVEEFAKEDETSEEEKCPECGKPKDECECDKTDFSVNEETIEEDEISEEENVDEQGKIDEYNLNEIPEYMELTNSYNDLQSRYSALEEERNKLLDFKKSIEKKEKEAMINSFYMLSDEDKKDVIDNIDTYSLDDIEAKLSIICVRNKVSFEDTSKKEDTVTYSLEQGIDEDSNMPAWVKSLQNVAKSMN